MQRNQGPSDEPTLVQIDPDTEKHDISGTQWMSSAIIAYLRLVELKKSAEPAERIPELEQLRSTNESLWRENQQLKRAEEKARSDMSLLQCDLTHYQDTISQKDQEIAFLQAHIAQLTQTISQLSPTPGEEVIRKRCRWQFWK